MKSLEEFVKVCVKIEQVDTQATPAFGHYPFQLHVEESDGQFVMSALALGGQIQQVLAIVRSYYRKDAKTIYLSVDFPAGGDVESDFVFVVSIIGKEFGDAYAIPYSTVDGSTSDIIKVEDSSHLQAILSQFKSFILK